MPIAPSQASPTDQTSCWNAVAMRDPAADARFVYAVRTTGIYCRPTCPSRLAKRAHVAFYPDAASAERDGFRPCKRCRPDGEGPAQARAATVTRACHLIATSARMPSLAALARAAGLSASHFHRAFKAATGVTPRAYARQCRADRAAAALNTAPSVTDAVYAAGFSGPSRFHAAARLGMTPRSYRDGGAGRRIRFAVSNCSLGGILVAATDAGLCAITLGDDPDSLVRDLRTRFAKADLREADADFAATVAAVVAFVDAPRGRLDLPLDIRGTAFQQQVWQALTAVPPGTTATYAQIAAAVGAPKAVRAVATACGANPVAVAIPCHRIVRSDGTRSGYRWGPERKQALLDREAAKT